MVEENEPDFELDEETALKQGFEEAKAKGKLFNVNSWKRKREEQRAKRREREEKERKERIKEKIDTVKGYFGLVIFGGIVYAAITFLFFPYKLFPIGH